MTEVYPCPVVSDDSQGGHTSTDDPPEVTPSSDLNEFLSPITDGSTSLIPVCDEPESRTSRDVTYDPTAESSRNCDDDVTNRMAVVDWTLKRAGYISLALVLSLTSNNVAFFLFGSEFSAFT